MQQDPLLEKLDWFSTSNNWTLDFLNSMVLPLTKITSDHVPGKISISTSIPKSSIFRFKNFLPKHPGFMEASLAGWSAQVRNTRDSASIIAGKFKNTRQKLKFWSRNLSNLAQLIKHCNKFIFFLDAVEDCRPLLLPEWKCRVIIKNHLQNLLKYKNIY